MTDLHPFTQAIKDGVEKVCKNPAGELGWYVADDAIDCAADKFWAAIDQLVREMEINEELKTADERTEKFIAGAVKEIVNGNNGAAGNYIIVIQPSVVDKSTIYTWQWFWSPAVPIRIGKAD